MKSDYVLIVNGVKVTVKSLCLVPVCGRVVMDAALEIDGNYYSFRERIEGLSLDRSESSLYASFKDSKPDMYRHIEDRGIAMKSFFDAMDLAILNELRMRVKAKKEREEEDDV